MRLEVAPHGVELALRVVAALVVDDGMSISSPTVRYLGEGSRGTPINCDGVPRGPRPLF